MSSDMAGLRCGWYEARSLACHFGEAYPFGVLPGLYQRLFGNLLHALDGDLPSQGLALVEASLDEDQRLGRA
ncbi:hypothetical protein D3C81_1894630 [compost metagenome]